MQPRTLNKIHANSKKIQKEKSSRGKETTTSTSSPKYKTFPKKTRRHILENIWEFLTDPLDLYSLRDEFSSENLLELIDDINTAEYNSAIRHVLTQHDYSFKDESTELTVWRRKIRDWAKAIDKSERRGSPVVPPEKTEHFRQAVHQILDTMPCRCVLRLKDRLLEVIEAYHKESQPSHVPFNTKQCSKHWWHDFLKKNDDIKEKWENLPLERQLGKLGRMRSEGSISQETQETEAHSNSGISDFGSPIEIRVNIFSPDEAEELVTNEELNNGEIFQDNVEGNRELLQESNNRIDDVDHYFDFAGTGENLLPMGQMQREASINWPFLSS